MIIKTSITLDVDVIVPLEEDDRFYFKDREYVFETCYVEEAADYAKLLVVVEAADCRTEEPVSFVSEELDPTVEINIDFNKIKFCLNDSNIFSYIKRQHK